LTMRVRLALAVVAAVGIVSLLRVWRRAGDGAKTVVRNGGDVDVDIDTGSRATCSPHQHVMFLKTHKCASSSVQNMFLRYGVQHNLSFVLPVQANYLGNPKPFQADMVPASRLPPGGRGDIFAVHTRLNPPQHAKVLHEDTKYVTVVRDPTTLFESMFNFFHLNAYSYNKTSLVELLSLSLENQMSFEPKTRFRPNMMLFDMGFDLNATSPVNQVRRAVDAMDKLFDVVLVAEKMDESLILLKEHLCWEYNDVVFISRNSRKDKAKPEPLSENNIEKLRELNSADQMLYNHFLARHENEVLRFGWSRMAREVSTLRALREEVFDQCEVSEVEKAPAGSSFKEYSGQVNAFMVPEEADEQCLLLSLPELHLLNHIRESRKGSQG